MACHKEHISAPRLDEEDEPSKDCRRVREYLMHQPWIFLPDERQGSLKQSEPKPGRLFKTKDVAIRDLSGLCSDRHERVTHEMVRTVAQSVSARTVKEHYPHRRYSPATVIDLFKHWGVANDISWDVYLEILHSVDRRVCEEDLDHVWEHDQILHLDMHASVTNCY